MKTVAYIPWKGYFDLIASVDEFILFDDMQYTRRDWRNRNQIKTPQGLQWLTVLVRVKGKYFQAIRDAEIDGGIRLSWIRLWRVYRASAVVGPFRANVTILDLLFNSGPKPIVT
jgi:hypothetical protein